MTSLRFLAAGLGMAVLIAALSGSKERIRECGWMTRRKDRNQRQQVRAVLESLMTRLRPVGLEFLDIRGTCSCRLGLPRWRESKEEQAQRARQEMEIFQSLDHAGTVAVQTSEMPELHAWEMRLEREGYDCLNHRVGDRGVLHLYWRALAGDQPMMDDEALSGAAEEIEGIVGL